MRYKITLDDRDIRVWIRTCKRCGEQRKIMQGKTSRVCIDCLKWEDNETYKGRFLINILQGLTSSSIITGLFNGSIKRKPIKPDISKGSWERR